MILLLVACLSASSTPEVRPAAAPAPVGVAPAPAPPPEPEPEPAPVGHPNPPPEGWVDLAVHIPGIQTEIRYHTADNFTGAPLPGYGTASAWLKEAPADALAAVQRDLEAKGLGLIVYDAYRPLRGTLSMVAWAHRTDQVHLLDNGYIARRSGHNKGNTIDLSVVDLGTDTPLDMGTPWDTLTEASHTTNTTGQSLANRLILRDAMHAHGWRNYSKEWWHYSFKMEGDLPHRDVPYGCWEAPEGAWTAPEGWRSPEHVMPAVVVPQPCARDAP